MTDAVPPPVPKPVWPLFLVAALSFIPFLGIFFGGAGATWGLVSSRRKALWAAALAMTGTLLNFAGIMMFGMSTNASMTKDAEVNTRVTQGELQKVVAALEAYHAKEHAYPPTLKVLQQRMILTRVVPIMDASAGFMHLPHDFHYVLAPDGESYDLVATGPDNIIGTADDVRPVLPDSIRAHSGFRPQTPAARP